MFKKINFSQHSLLQLKLRSILISEVKTVIKSPTVLINQNLNRFRAIGTGLKTYGKDHILIVIYDMNDDNSITVVTAFRTSKKRKYL